VGLGASGIGLRENGGLFEDVTECTLLRCRGSTVSLKGLVRATSCTVLD
jgi:hypothetical protein